MTEQVQSDFDKWLESQDESTKQLINERFSKLEATVKATRQERDDLTHELKDLSKKITEDSEAGKQLGELRAKLDASEKKSSFIDSAVQQGVLRPSAAFAIANADNLFTEKGEPDWQKIRESVPELFKVSNTNTNAGSGTNTALPNRDVNQAIREAAQNKNN